MNKADMVAPTLAELGKWKVGGSLDLGGCTGLTTLPEGLKVGGRIYK